MKAKQVLQGVIDQFSSRVACLRELVQNSIDAGADRIDVWFDRREGFHRVAVEDYGCGMTRQHITDYLLNVFQSSKEDDLESIGRFGIGFVSVFALKPKYVVVETSRDGEHTRIVIDEELGIEWFEGEPRMGTVVSLYLDVTDAGFEGLVKEGVAFLRHSCRYVDVELVVRHLDTERAINTPLELDLPIQASLDENGTEIRCGFEQGPPHYVLMNRRLVLEEGKRALAPGVTVLASSRDIEHNLARNAVIQDGNFERFMGRLEELVEGELLPRLIDRLEARKGPRTVAMLDSVLRFWESPERAPRPWSKLLDLPIVPVLDRGRERSWSIGRAIEIERRIPVERSVTELARLVSRDGEPVVISTPEWPVAELLARLTALRTVVLSEAMCWASPAPAGLATPFRALCDAVEATGRSVYAARIESPDVPPPAVALAERVQMWDVGSTPEAGEHLALNAADPALRAIADRAKTAPGIAVQLLFRALEALEILHAGPSDEALDGWLAARTAR